MVQGFSIPNQIILGIDLCCTTFAINTYAPMCIFVIDIMSHHWGILGQLFWLDGNRSRFELLSKCKWMLLQLAHEPIGFNGCGLT